MKDVDSFCITFEPKGQGLYDREIEPVNDWTEFISALRMIVPTSASIMVFDSNSKVIGSQFELSVWIKRLFRKQRTNVLKIVLGKEENGICGMALNFLQDSMSKWNNVEQGIFCQQFETYGTNWSQYTMEGKSADALRKFYARHGKKLITENKMKEKLDQENQTMNGNIASLVDLAATTKSLASTLCDVVDDQRKRQKLH